MFKPTRKDVKTEFNARSDNFAIGAAIFAAVALILLSLLACEKAAAKPLRTDTQNMKQSFAEHSIIYDERYAPCCACKT